MHSFPTTVALSCCFVAGIIISLVFMPGVM